MFEKLKKFCNLIKYPVQSHFQLLPEHPLELYKQIKPGFKQGLCPIFLICLLSLSYYRTSLWHWLFKYIKCYRVCLPSQGIIKFFLLFSVFSLNRKLELNLTLIQITYFGHNTSQLMLCTSHHTTRSEVHNISCPTQWCQVWSFNYPDNHYVFSL